jgi:hypothetical protein
VQAGRSSHHPFRRAFWFGTLDSRPLSLFRIAFALLLLKDALYHLPLAGVFYSDTGVLPRAVLLDGLAAPNRFGLMEAIGYDWMAALFFLLWAVVALGLLVGYRARLMSILNFLIVLSVHERNVYVLTGADTVLRVLSFWMMFLPLAQYYSVDARRMEQGKSETRRAAYAFPWRMIQLQVALIYLVTGLLKLMGNSWRNGEVLYTVLQIQTLLLPTGQWLGVHAPEWLLRLGTWGVLLTELTFPFLVFAPARPLRKLALAAGTALHIGIALTMVMPMTDFSLVMLTSYLLFFEPEWVQRLENWTRGWLRTFPQTFQSRLRRAGGALSSLLYPGQPVEAEETAQPEHNTGQLALTLALGGLMLLVIGWNLGVIAEYANQPSFPALPALPEAVLEYTGLWQYWDMFAPTPLQIDGWLTVGGHFEDGRDAELFALRPNGEQPPAVEWGPAMRWYKYVENINDSRDDRLLRALGRYYCRQYNTVDNLPVGARLATLEVHYRYRYVHRPGEPVQPLASDLLWSHWCFDEYAPSGG